MKLYADKDQDKKLSVEVESNYTGRFALIILIFLTFLLFIGWQFKCQLGLGECIYRVNEVEISYKTNSVKHKAIIAYEKAPCNLTAKIKLNDAISKSIKSADLAKLWFKWGSSEQCQIPQAERASYFIRSYQNAIDSGLNELASSAINYSLEAMPYSPRLQLTAAQHYYTRSMKQQAIKAYKLATYYAGGYENIDVTQLWQFFKMLNQTQKYCEALGVLRHLHTRTRGQIKVEVAIDEILNSGGCDIPFDAPVILKQSSKSGLIFPVTLNGIVGTFLIDTGANITTITRNFADRLGLEPATTEMIEVQTANGISFASPAIIKSLSFGQNLWKNHMVMINQKEFGKFDGLLGFDILSQYDISKKGKEWTLKRRELN